VFYQVMKVISSLDRVVSVLFLSNGKRGGGGGDNIHG